jgi:hypothetical protein
MKKELIDLSGLASGEFGDTTSTVMGNLINREQIFRSAYDVDQKISDTQRSKENYGNRKNVR